MTVPKNVYEGVPGMQAGLIRELGLMKGHLMLMLAPYVGKEVHIKVDTTFM